MQSGYAKARITEEKAKPPDFKRPTWNGITNQLEGEADVLLDFCMWLQREEIFNMLVSLANRGELK